LHDVVSELAAWLHSYGWPVEIVASNDPSIGLSRALGRSAGTSEVLGLSYRLKRLSPWLVHAFEPTEADAARMAGVPYVLSVPTVAHAEVSAGPDALRELEVCLRSARQVITQSRAAASNLLQTFGVESTVVPDGVDTKRLGAVPIRRGRPLVVCPTFEIDHDDLEMLVDAFVLVASSVDGAQLAIAGPLSSKSHGELVSRMPERLRSQLLVLEKADRKRVLTMFGRASVTCVPSATGSSGRSVVESLAVGTPVVCADGGSAAEIIDEEAVVAGAGLRFAAGDVGGCAESLTGVMEQSSSEGVVERCRSRAYLFDWSFVGPRLVEIYRHSAGAF
jgi:glycosyltransferase involved in cell wall biosynthesis